MNSVFIGHEYDDKGNLIRSSFFKSEDSAKVWCKEPRRIYRSYRKDQTCNFCLNPDSILTPETCCTGCSKLNYTGSLM